MSLGDQSNQADIMKFREFRIELTGRPLRSTVIFERWTSLPASRIQGATA